MHGCVQSAHHLLLLVLSCKMIYEEQFKDHIQNSCWDVVLVANYKGLGKSYFLQMILRDVWESIP